MRRFRRSAIRAPGAKLEYRCRSSQAHKICCGRHPMMSLARPAMATPTGGRSLVMLHLWLHSRAFSSIARCRFFAIGRFGALREFRERHPLADLVFDRRYAARQSVVLCQEISAAVGIGSVMVIVISLRSAGDRFHFAIACASRTRARRSCEAPFIWDLMRSSSRTNELQSSI